MKQVDHDRATNPPWRDRVGNAAFLALMKLAQALPYERRIPAMGWFFAHILGPVAGWRRRIRRNLRLARPDLSLSEIRRLERAVPANAGRAMAETYSGAEFSARLCGSEVLTGPGLPALQDAAKTGRAVVIASAHFGNYDAIRAAMYARGWPIGGLFRPMNNAAFNEHYTAAIRSISEPLFPRGRAGLTAMLRFLKGGGWLAIGFDQYDGKGSELRFFGLPTKTVLTPAELAIRYDALLIPVLGIRQPDGLNFRVEIGAPIIRSEPENMMQKLNDDLEQQVREHMEQWFWVHRRWKQLY